MEHQQTLNRTAFQATAHCLTGCAIGEVLGLVIGTALGWHDVATIALAVALAFVFGYALTIGPLLRDVVHPLSDRALVERVIAAARETGAASAAMPLYGSVHEIQKEPIGSTIGTSLYLPLWLTQKPAVVPRAALLHGLELDALAPRPDGAATVDMVARAGVRPAVADLRLAEKVAPPWPGWD